MSNWTGNDTGAYNRTESINKSHDVYFKVHNSFSGSTDINTFCKGITYQVNSVYRKTTCRSFNYKGFEFVDSWPGALSGPFVMPSDGFKIIIYLIPMNPDWDGSSLIDGDGNTIVFCGIRNITSIPDMGDVNTVCHEIAHGYGVAIGEYYTIKMLVDFTGVQPSYKVSSLLPADHYWHTPEHTNWLVDPMLMPNPINPRFCWLSSFIINSGKYRTTGPDLPDLDNVKVRVTVNGKPIDKECDVSVWRNSKLANDKIGVFKPDDKGVITFPWNLTSNNKDVALSDNFRIIKAFKNGQWVVNKGVSIWDIQTAYIKSGFKTASVYLA